VWGPAGSQKGVKKPHFAILCHQPYMIEHPFSYLSNSLSTHAGEQSSAAREARVGRYSPIRSRSFEGNELPKTTFASVLGLVVLVVLVVLSVVPLVVLV
jgi:hypothetical protein